MEESMQTLIGMIGHAPWINVIGAIVIVACGFSRKITSKVTGWKKKWISSITHFINGIGVAMFAAGEHVTWWLAMLSGAGASFSSSGLGDLVADWVGKISKGSATAALLLLAFLVAGCGGAPCRIVREARQGDLEIIQSIDDGNVERARDIAQTAADALEALETATCSGGLGELLSPSQDDPVDATP